MADCNNCIFPVLRGCPVNGSLNNAACLYLYKDKDVIDKKEYNGEVTYISTCF